MSFFGRKYTMKLRTIFIVDDDPFFTELAMQVIKGLGPYNFEIFSNGHDFLARLDQNPFLVLLDHHLGQESGLDLLREVKARFPYAFVIYVSGQDEVKTAVDALKYGAFDYVVKEDFCGPFLMNILEKIATLTEILEAKEKKKERHKMAMVVLTLGISYLFWRD